MSSYIWKAISAETSSVANACSRFQMHFLLNSSTWLHYPFWRHPLERSIMLKALSAKTFSPGNPPSFPPPGVPPPSYRQPSTHTPNLVRNLVRVTKPALPFNVPYSTFQIAFDLSLFSHTLYSFNGKINKRKYSARSKIRCLLCGKSKILALCWRRHFNDGCHHL